MDAELLHSHIRLIVAQRLPIDYPAVRAVYLMADDLHVVHEKLDDNHRVVRTTYKVSISVDEVN